MNRTILINKITHLFSILVSNIKLSDKMNLTDDSVNSENIFRDVLNICYNYNLANTNLFKSNYGAIDLKDDENKVIVQVTAQRSTQKVQDTLNNEILKQFKDYRMIFIIISDGSITNLQSHKYDNPFLNAFKNEDIFAMVDILRIIQTLSIYKLGKIVEILQENLIVPSANIKLLDSNLTSIINMLSKNDLVSQETNINLNKFEIEKKIDFNNLTAIHDEILEFSGYYSKLNSKYKTLSLSGKNKEQSVLNKLHHFYKDSVSENKNFSACEIYENVVERVINFVKETPNFEDSIAEEELLLSVEIVVCDAFIKCKIFKNPEGYKYVN